MTVISVLPPDGSFAEGLNRLVRQIGKPDAGALGGLLAPGVDEPGLQAQFTAAASWGACRSGTVESGDGATSVAVRMSCTRGALMLNATFDAKTNRFSRVTLAPAGGQTCVQ